MSRTGILRGRVAPGTAYVAGGSPFADVFTSDIETSMDSAIRMTVTVDAPVNIFKRMGGNNIDLNAGLALEANQQETFVFDQPEVDPFNIRFGGNCNILECVVMEIQDGVV